MSLEQLYQERNRLAAQIANLRSMMSMSPMYAASPGNMQNLQNMQFALNQIDAQIMALGGGIIMGGGEFGSFDF